MSLWSRMAGVGQSGFGYGSTASEVVQELDLSEKTMLVTGVTSGLGAETARVLMARGARVLGLGRSLDAIRAAQGGAPSEGLVPIELDLADLESIGRAAETVKGLGPLDAIINNAGIMALPKLELVRGYEKQFFTNHVGHYALTRLCLESLAPRGRVVAVSSEAHRAAPRIGIDFDNLRGEKKYSAWSAYGRSKLANILFAFELGRRLSDPTMMAHALHPGVIHTNLSRHSSLADFGYAIAAPIALKSIAEGAATQTYVATSPKVAAFPPTYFKDSNPAQARNIAYSAPLGLRLWDFTEDLLRELGLELPALPRRGQVESSAPVQA